MDHDGGSTTWIVRLAPAGPGARLAVKDCIDVAGLPTTVGCPVIAERARPAGQDAAVVAAGGEEFRYPHHAVRDAIDVGRERFGNDRDPHAHKVRHEQITASQSAMTFKQNIRDFLGVLAPRTPGHE